MTASRMHGRFIAGLGMAAFLMGTAPSWAACAGDYNGPLDAAVAKVGTALKTDNPTLLLELIGSQGLTIGQDGEASSKVKLTADFKAKTNRYCDFFTCVGKTAPLRKLIVAREQRKSVSVVGGRVFAVVTLSPGSGTDEAELHFIYTDQCKWELTAIGYL